MQYIHHNGIKYSSKSKVNAFIKTETYNAFIMNSKAKKSLSYGSSRMGKQKIINS